MATKTTKKWYESKTILVNIAGAIAASLELLDVNILTAFGVTDPLRSMAIIGFVVSLANMYLRTTSTKAIVSRKPKTNDIVK